MFLSICYLPFAISKSAPKLPSAGLTAPPSVTGILGAPSVVISSLLSFALSSEPASSCARFFTYW
ncbi:MAG: hypothetical protein ACTTIU_01185 [Treponema lecithinolyticum]|uniref:hypothetical protein n=1 Tax=Treponema lecithinolyticum TaxID=53418 RepID=UPI003FA2BF01